MAVNTQIRIERFQAAIHADPAAEHSLDDLAGIAALSRFHFHRVFAATTGETVAEALRRIRLGRAAKMLARSRLPVAQIGRAHGYPNPGSFSRAFRAAFGLSPSQFRHQRVDPVDSIRQSFRHGDPAMYRVRLSHLPARRIVGVAHRGPYPQMGRTFVRMSDTLGQAGLWPQVDAMIAVYLDDPAIVAPADLRGLAAVSVEGDPPLPAGFVARDLVGRRGMRCCASRARMPALARPMTGCSAPGWRGPARSRATRRAGSCM